MPLIHCLQAAQDAGLINEKQHKAMLADADKRIKSGIDEKAAGQQVINEFANKAGEKLHTDLNKIKASLRLPTEEFKGFETKGNPQEITDKFNQAKSELQKPEYTDVDYIAGRNKANEILSDKKSGEPTIKMGKGSIGSGVFRPFIKYSEHWFDTEKNKNVEGETYIYDDVNDKYYDINQFNKSEVDFLLDRDNFTEKPSETKPSSILGSDVVKEDLGGNQSFDSRTKYTVEGGELEIGKVKKSNRFSVLSLNVDEPMRRKGVATKLLKEAIRDTKGMISGQASNDGSVDLNYKLGMRAYEDGKELSLDETKKLRAKQTSVNMKFSNPDYEREAYKLSQRKKAELDKIKQENSSHNRATIRNRSEVNKAIDKFKGLTPKEISDALIRSDLPVDVKKALVSKDFEKALQLTKSDEERVRELYEREFAKLDKEYPKINVPKNILEEKPTQSQNIKPKEVSNAIQEQSTGSILQHPQETVGETGGGRGRVESSEQGNEPTGTQPKPEEKSIDKGQEEKVGTFGKAARKIADVIDKAELPSWAKSDIEGLTKQGASTEEIKKLLKEAVIAIGDALDKGVEFSKAVADAAQDLINLHGKKGNDETILKGLASYYKDKTGYVEEGKPTQLSHAGTERLREEFGGEEAPEKQKESFEKWSNEADAAIKDGYDVNGLLDKIENEGHSTSPTEHFILVKTADALAQKLRSIKNINDPEFNKTLDQIDRINTLSDIAGSAKGKELGARRYKTINDDSLVGFLLQEKELNKGAPLTENQKVTAINEHTKIESAQEDFKKKYEDLQAQYAKLIADREVKKTQASTPKNVKKTHDDFVKEREPIIKNIKDKWNNAGKDILSSDIPYRKQLAAIAPDVAKLVKSLVEEGVTKLEDIVKNIHGQLKDDIPSLQEKDVHDIIAGVHTEKKPLKNEVAKKYQDLKYQAQLINRLNNLENGQVPKNEKAQIKRNQEIHGLQQKIKGHGLNKLSVIKSRNETELSKIQEQLKKGDFAVPEKKSPLTDMELRKRFPEQFKAAQQSKDALIKAKRERAIRIMKQAYENKTPTEKTVEVVSKALNVPRTIMASMDYSAPLRQAIVATTAHPHLAAKALDFMFKASVSEKVYNRWLEDVHNSDRWDLSQKIKLAITDPESLHVKEKEEAFQGAPYAEKIPIVGEGIKASERAYAGYLNKIRWDLFNMYADKFEEQGKTLDNSEKLYKGLASFINSATGRGNMSAFESASPVLNWFLFASRLIASRVNMLGLTDIPNLATRAVTFGTRGIDYGFYTKLPPELRIEAAKDMAKFVGIGIATLLLAKQLPGTSVEIDPRSSDFGKIKVGNTRWDIWGGFQPYARVLTQAIAGERKATTTGQIYELNGKGFMGENRLSPLETFGREKLAPVPSTAIDLISHRNAVGQPVTVGNELVSDVTPLLIQDVYQGMKEQGVKALFTVGIPSAFGVGVQTYQPKPPKQGTPQIQRPVKVHKQTIQKVQHGFR